MFSLWRNSIFFIGFVFNQYFKRFGLYFFEMIMLIRFVGTLTRTTMGVGRVTFACKGPMIGQYVFVMAKSQSFICVLFSNIISGGSLSYLKKKKKKKEKKKKRSYAY